MRGPWCWSARTHIRVQRAVCMRWHLPSLPVQWARRIRFASVMRGVQQFGVCCELPCQAHCRISLGNLLGLNQG